MKHSLKRVLCFVLTAAMIICLVPAAFAATTTTPANNNNKDVLKSITYDYGDDTKKVSVAAGAREITLEIPYSQISTVDIASDDLDYNSGFDVVVPHEVSPLAGGDSGKLVIDYTLAGSDDMYTTEYTIKVTRAAKKEPTYKGTITDKAIVGEEDIEFTEEDFLDKYTQNDGQGLYGIKITGSHPSWGELKLKGNTYNVGSSAKVILASELDDLKFVATKGSTSSVTYTVTAYDKAAPTKEIGTGFLKLSAEAPKPPSMADLSYDLNKSETVKVSGGDIFDVTPSGEEVDYIKFTSLPSSGNLKYNSSSSVTTTDSYYMSASGSNKLIKNISYTASSSTGTYTAKYIAYTVGGTELEGTMKFVVKSSTASGDDEDDDGTVNKIKYSTSKNKGEKFDYKDFTEVCETWDSSKTLGYVIFDFPESKYGKLYYNYTSDANKGTALTSSSISSKKFKMTTSGTDALSKVAYVPVSAADGRDIEITYTAYSSSGTKFYEGKVVVSVDSDSDYADFDKTIRYDVKSNKDLDFVRNDFKYSNTSPEYIIFNTIPSTSKGQLYHGSTSSSSNKIDSDDKEDTKFYWDTNKSKNISDITFVPKKSYDGDVEIEFTAYDDDKEDLYEGIIVIDVDEVGGKDDDDDDDEAETIEYEVAANDYVTFKASDFNSECKDLTDETLDWVKFELPDDDEGTLYYKYDSSGKTKVSESKKYYRSGTPALNDVSFVPEDDFDGTVTIEYEGENSEGDEFTGEIEIEVTEADDSIVTYTVDCDDTVTFDEDDFDDASNEKNGEDIRYIKLSSVSSSYGKIYYNYNDSPGVANYTASTTTSYYATGGSNPISNLTFVPDTEASATVTFKYKGTDMEGDTFTGEIKIKILGEDDDDEDDDEDEDDDTIVYEIKSGNVAKFKATDFNEVCDTVNEEKLDYVKFTLPSTSYGKLYENYSSTSNPGTLVTSSKKYYRSGSPSIGNITFVPANGFTGTCSINFEGMDEEGDEFEGTVKIKVSGSDKNTNASTIAYKTDNKTPVKLIPSDFNAACYDATNKTLSAVSFSVPSATYGKLYQNYTSATSTGTAVSAGTKYYYSNTNPQLGAVTFVPNSSYTGTLIINYRGYTTTDDVFSGTITFTITGDGTPTSKTSSSYFNDVGTNYSWAATAIDYLYEKGIVTGKSTGIFAPAENIKRGDFILMLQRAFDFNTDSTTPQFYDVSSNSYYASAILAAKANGIAKGGGDNKFYPESSLKREDAMVFMVRALEAADMPFTKGSASDLSSFSDRNQISSYATEAIASLVKSGYVTGSGGKINPQAPITRAEMSVMLYRVIAGN